MFNTFTVCKKQCTVSYQLNIGCSQLVLFLLFSYQYLRGFLENVILKYSNLNIFSCRLSEQSCFVGIRIQDKIFQFRIFKPKTTDYKCTFQLVKYQMVHVSHLVQYECNMQLSEDFSCFFVLFFRTLYMAVYCEPELGCFNSGILVSVISGALCIA